LVKSARLPYIEREKAFSICLARRDMNFVRTYVRVLKELGSESRIAIILVLANLALAAAQFAEPILFGRIIDKLAEAQKSDVPLQWEVLAPLIAAWVGFGLFTIAAAVLVALHSDRLSHRRRLAVMGAYFEHVLHLPLSFHTASH
jgi:ATP-binding cassette subfamily B protein